MKYIFLCLLCIGAVGSVSGQQIILQDEHRFVAVPRDQGLLFIVPQPDCPLRFEEAKLVSNMKGIWLPSFSLHNHGTKPIRGFKVAVAGNGEWSWEAADPSQYVMPGQSAPFFKDSRDEIVPITEELRDKLKLRGSMKNIQALIVVSVEYADGSRFQADGYDALKEYFETIYAGCFKPKPSQ
jgi:hypothetical protein